jgi:formylglycine-generating enzyme required for sulfatase activity
MVALWWMLFVAALVQTPTSAGPAGGSPVYQSPSLGRMPLIPPGSFTMGCESDSEDAFERCEGSQVPAHAVTLTTGFYMMEHEVTQGEWVAVMGRNPSRFSSCGSTCPVENVSWNDVRVFIEKVSARDGRTYRLPTEAEWEFAARGGASEVDESPDAFQDVAWFVDPPGGPTSSGGKTHPACGKVRNAFGLCDMIGNVREWTADWYGRYPSSSQVDPQGPPTGSYRVDRGGSWNDLQRFDLGVALRDWGNEDFRCSLLGFRLVSSVP